MLVVVHDVFADTFVLLARTELAGWKRHFKVMFERVQARFVLVLLMGVSLFRCGKTLHTKSTEISAAFR